MKRINSYLKNFVVILTLVTVSACGGGGGGGGGGELEAPVANLSGTWKITQSTISNNCNDPNGISSQEIVKYVQNGNNITITDGQGNVLKATISGNQVSVTGSFPDDGGTTTITNLVLTVSKDGKSSSGTASWTWIDDFGGCQGKTSVTGTFVPNNVGDPVRNIAGKWSLVEVVVTNTCTVTSTKLMGIVDISQNETDITVTIPNTTSIWKGTIIGNTVSWGGVTGSNNLTRKNMSLTLSTDGRSLRGTLNVEFISINDPNVLCQGKNTMTGTKI